MLRLVKPLAEPMLRIPRVSWPGAALAAVAACTLLMTDAVVAQGPAPAAAPPGDTSRGKALVESSGCFDCHRIDDRGSHLGPDLSDLGARRTPERLRQALVAPDEEVLPENRFVKLVTKDGVAVTGRLLNQDAISVQLITPKDELKSYLRATLREYAIVEKGLMPSVQGKLTDQQVADIVAYLSSLKGT
jgi:putative heme-binding domain-containing protein